MGSAATAAAAEDPARMGSAAAAAAAAAAADPARMGSAPDPRQRIFPIRHHGPGSARALIGELERWSPDCILIEGPADGTSLLRWLGHELMEPPAALLFYRPEDPQKASYFPYATFSPEYQAVRYALNHGAEVRLIDLPQSYLLGLEHKVEAPDREPFQLLAQAGGHPDYEAWWNLTIEQRRDGADIFEGVLGLMREMRSGSRKTDPSQEPPPVAADPIRARSTNQPPPVAADPIRARSTNQPPPAAADPIRARTTGAGHLLAERREAHMRQEIRRALAEGFVRIAVVCGAWHGPALADYEDFTEDDALLAGLEHVDVEMAWVPWTYSRLAMHSGYGAGVRSPGWYDHLWHSAEAGRSPGETAALWLAQVGRLLREEGLEASPAHVIEAQRLAEALAALRGRPLPGLLELEEAIRTVLCEGRSEPLQLIERRLTVGERMGMVPPEAPIVPLYRDLLAEMKRLRLRPDPDKSSLKLDLRHESHLARSQLLQRLIFLNIPWGKQLKPRSAQGTYSEVWQLQWRPDFAVKIVEANLWGNTVAAAAAALARQQGVQAKQLAELTRLLDQVILAGLDDIVPDILRQIDDISARSSDIPLMMDALPPLARIMRYGSVRQLDQALIGRVVETLLTRISIGLPSTCAHLNDDAAAAMLTHLLKVHGVIGLIPHEEQRTLWWDTLLAMVDQPGLHGLLAGRICRWLYENDRLTTEETALRLERALSPARLASMRPEVIQQAAAWLDGFLGEADLLLIHDHRLWQLLDEWVCGLADEPFTQLVPLLRRTFSSLSAAARRQLGERVFATSGGGGAPPQVHPRLDPARGERVVARLANLTGLS